MRREKKRKCAVPLEALDDDLLDIHRLDEGRDENISLYQQ